MDRRGIQKFAIWARSEMLDAVGQRVYFACHELSEESAERMELERELARRGDALVEEAAWLWFNRLAALRFLEVNGFLPDRIRAFTDESGAFRPELLARPAEAGVSAGLLREWAGRGGDDALYRELLLWECDRLSGALEGMFGMTRGWERVLLPDGLLRKDSVIGRMLAEIPEEDWRDVRIIGWLYQYYNTEKKDEAFLLRKRKEKLSGEQVASATQLFTPDWITRFLVENSLGRLWLESRPDSALRSEWRFFLGEERRGGPRVRPEELRVIDPCMGSGHILVSAFDALLRIYESEGVRPRDAARSILEKNLVGLDIDPRAAQLAEFALLMRAREVDRGILREPVRLSLGAVSRGEGISEEDARAFAGEDGRAFSELMALLEALSSARVAGSLAETPALDYPALRARAEKMGDGPAKRRVLEAIRTGEALSAKYSCVITNPPYLGIAGMNEELAEFARTRFPDAKSDLFSCFIERGNRMLAPGGMNAMVTMQSWLFLSSWRELRKRILSEYDIAALLHMDNDVMGIAFGTAAWVLRRREPGTRGVYTRVSARDLVNGEPPEFPVPGNPLRAVSAEALGRIPGMPIAYWAGPGTLRAFSDGTPLGSLADSRQGIATADNERYLRRWHEVRREAIHFDCLSHEESRASDKRWYPYNKGGAFRKWYGNDEFVIDWEKGGMRLRQSPRAVLRNAAYHFRECFSWSLVSSGAPSFRYKPAGRLFDVAGMSCFSEDGLGYLLGLCNSAVAREMLEILAPTINYQCGDIANIPVIPPASELREEVERLVGENVALAKADWDSAESSWEFSGHPLARLERPEG